MAKTKDELTSIIHSFEELKKNLNELSDDELEQVTGGAICSYCYNEGKKGIDQDCEKRIRSLITGKPAR